MVRVPERERVYGRRRNGGRSCRRILIWWCHAGEWRLSCTLPPPSLSLSLSIYLSISISSLLAFALAIVLAHFLALGVSVAILVVVTVTPKKMERKEDGWNGA